MCPEGTALSGHFYAEIACSIRRNIKFFSISYDFYLIYANRFWIFSIFEHKFY